MSAKTEKIKKEDRLAGQAVKKYSNGDSISDEELSAAIIVLTRVIDSLGLMGSRYTLAYASLLQTLNQFEGFQRSRREDD